MPHRHARTVLLCRPIQNQSAAAAGILMPMRDLGGLIQRYWPLLSPAFLGLFGFWAGGWKARRDLRMTADRETIRSLLASLPTPEDFSVGDSEEDDDACEFDPRPLNRILTAVHRTTANPLMRLHSRTLRNRLATLQMKLIALNAVVHTSTWRTVGGKQETTLTFDFDAHPYEPKERAHIRRLISEVYRAHESFLRAAKKILIHVDKPVAT